MLRPKNFHLSINLLEATWLFLARDTLDDDWQARIVEECDCENHPVTIEEIEEVVGQNV